jgi:putative membrane protein
MAVLILKAIHVIGFVAWFAGLFYLVRMFVYHVEARAEEEPRRSILTEQFGIMEVRVFRIISQPAMVITWLAGIGMLVANPTYLQMGWLHVKLGLLVLLLVYHFYCGGLIKRLEKGETPMTGFQFRLFNEVPTLLLVGISFIAVLGKAGSLNYGYLLLGIVAFGVLMVVFARLYRALRKQRSKSA